MHASATTSCELTLVAWRLGDLALTDLWWCYIGLGGSRLHDALADYLAGTTQWPVSEHNVLAQALNERLWELDCPSLAPHRDPDDDRR